MSQPFREVEIREPQLDPYRLPGGMLTIVQSAGLSPMVNETSRVSPARLTVNWTTVPMLEGPRSRSIWSIGRIGWSF